MKTPTEGIVHLPIQIDKWKMLERNLIPSFDIKVELVLPEGKKGTLTVTINEVILVDENKEGNRSIVSNPLEVEVISQMIDSITKDKKGTSLVRMYQNLSDQISGSRVHLLYGTYKGKDNSSKNIAFMYLHSINICIYSIQKETETSEQFFAKYQMN